MSSIQRAPAWSVLTSPNHPLFSRRCSVEVAVDTQQQVTDLNISDIIEEVPKTVHLDTGPQMCLCASPLSSSPAGSSHRTDEFWGQTMTAHIATF